MVETSVGEQVEALETACDDSPAVVTRELQLPQTIAAKLALTG